MKQELAVFERQTEQPLSVSLLVDTSLSTAKEVRYETDSVSRFLKAVFREGNPARLGRDLQLQLRCDPALEFHSPPGTAGGRA